MNKIVTDLYVGAAKVSNGKIGTETFYDSKKYIEDGLIMNLCGVNMGGTDGWYDLVGTLKFTGDGERVYNGYKFNGSSHRYLKGNMSTNWSAKTHTVEVVYTPLSATWGCVYSCGPNGLLCYQYKQDGAVQSSDNVSGPNYSFISTVGNVMRVSINNSYCVYNETDATKSGTGSFTHSTNLPYIGCRLVGGSYYSTGNFVGIVHAIRVYNRILTPSEMKVNQAVDKLYYS